MTEDNVCARRQVDDHACWVWPDAEERRRHAQTEASGVGGRARVRRLRSARLACRKAAREA